MADQTAGDPGDNYSLAVEHAIEDKASCEPAIRELQQALEDEFHRRVAVENRAQALADAIDRYRRYDRWRWGGLKRLTHAAKDAA